MENRILAFVFCIVNKSLRESLKTNKNMEREIYIYISVLM